MSRTVVETSDVGAPDVAASSGPAPRAEPSVRRGDRPRRRRLCLIAVAFLALMAGTVAVVGFQREGDRVANGNATYDVEGWSVRSDAGPMSVKRVRIADGPNGINTAADIRRQGTAQGSWARTMISLRNPRHDLRVGQSYRLRALIRNVSGSPQPVGLLLANENYLHRPTTESRYLSLRDDAWHELTLTFVPTEAAEDDTGVYLALPAGGPVHFQVTGVSLRTFASSRGTPRVFSSLNQPDRTLEFSGPAGSAPDPAVWNQELGGNGWGNDEKQTYTSSRRNAALDGNGHLLITARRAETTGPDGIRRSYTSARLNSRGKVDLPPGTYVEAPIKAPVGAGVWPAFWLLGSNTDEVGWPAAGELDILEVLGSHPTIASSRIHMAAARDSKQDLKYGGGQQGGSTTFPHSLDTRVHVYGVYFGEDEVTFFIDRRPTLSFTAADARSSGRTWPFGQHQFIVLNVAVGGRESPRDTKFPRSMEVGTISIWHDGVPF